MKKKKKDLIIVSENWCVMFVSENYLKLNRDQYNVYATIQILFWLQDHSDWDP